MIRRAVLLILILAFLTVAVGCGMSAPAPPSMGVGGADEMSRESAPQVAPGAEAPPAMEEGQAVAWATQDIVGDRMIVRTGSLAIVVEDTEETLEAIERLASELGGYVSDLQSWRQDDQMAATVTVRILAASFDQARERIKELAIEVESENASGQDVTEEYVISRHVSTTWRWPKRNYWSCWLRLRKPTRTRRVYWPSTTRSPT